MKKLKFLFYSCGIISALSYTGYYLKDSINLKFKYYITEMDNSRFGSQNRGVNWGSKTDQIVNFF